MNRACPPCHHDCGQGDARHCPAHSLNTRRYSRTLVEAFGPHTSLQIEEPAETDYPGSWWFCMAAVAAFTAYVIWVTR